MKPIGLRQINTRAHIRQVLWNEMRIFVRVKMLGWRERCVENENVSLRASYFGGISTRGLSTAGVWQEDARKTRLYLAFLRI